MYLLVHVINLILTQQAVWTSAYEIAKNMLYFVLPILFITTESDMKRGSMAMIALMAMGSITALMSSLDLVTFDFARQAESRVELAYLPKSVGLFTAYGDMALLISLALLLAVGIRTYKSVIVNGMVVDSSCCSGYCIDQAYFRCSREMWYLLSLLHLLPII